jgi:hypothetical protein
MWRLIEQYGQLEAVLTALCDEYEAAPDTIEHDLIALASDLVDKGLLGPSASPAS